eukprot:CAMPEP_0115035020 /NCGR_PEP_ID=MMETSP0216-20121206/41121_1 /TAXON_ID=223996 /ORGANISM="Protocruzia adherens, Strain Boccale" /LENGTH=43 /DNA_ID= /DNA_START= /DNA_END= /DNA_ORIENTATION=
MGKSLLETMNMVPRISKKKSAEENRAIRANLASDLPQFDEALS